MADVPDLYAAFLGVLLPIFYPAGQPAPGAYSPLTKTQVILGKGWPQAEQINANMQSVDSDTGLNNVMMVTVFAVPGAIENLTRYPLDWQTQTPPVITTTAVVDETGTEITIGGTISTPQNIGVLINGQGVTYAVQAGDTLDAIATALAALINPISPATATGSVVDVPGARELVARVGGVGTSIKEVMRLRRRIQVTSWCPTPGLRDLATGPIIETLGNTDFLTLADGTAARIITVADAIIDDQQKPLIYRRNTIYSVEYATTITEQDTQIVVGKQVAQSNDAVDITTYF